MNDDERIRAFIEEAQGFDRQGNTAGAMECYRAALELMSLAYGTLLINFCRAILPLHLKNHAEDIAQEIFLYVLEYMPQWKTEQAVRVTLIGVARRRTIDFLRRHNTQRSYLRRFFFWRRFNPSERQRSAQTRLEEADLRNRAIEQLTVEDKQILYWYQRGIPIEEIAVSLKVRPESITRRIRRIREKLEEIRRRLEEGL